MRLQMVRMVYEDAEGIGPEDVVSYEEAARMLGIKSWKLRQLIDEEELTLLIDADAPKGWAWRWLLMRSEVEALGETRRPGRREGRRGW